jgi:hypothetical protein
MNKEVMEHIEAALNEVRALYMKAATRIEAIKPGEKIPATQLAEDLAKEQGMTGPQLYPTLKILTDNYPGVVIRRGAHGGIFRPLPTPAVDTTATNADTGSVQDKTSDSQ